MGSTKFRFQPLPASPKDTAGENSSPWRPVPEPRSGVVGQNRLPRIPLEAEAVLGFLGLCEAGAIHLISSEVLAFEVSRIPDEVRRAYSLEVMTRASTHVQTSDSVVERARVFQEAGIRPLDALHLSSAVEGQADFFCTCDDKLLKRARLVETGWTKAVSPLELIEEIDRWQSN